MAFARRDLPQSRKGQGEEVCGEIGSLPTQFWNGNRLVKSPFLSAAQGVKAADYLALSVTDISSLGGVGSDSQRIGCEQIAHQQLLDKGIVQLAIVRLRTSATQDIAHP